MQAHVLSDENPFQGAEQQFSRIVELLNGDEQQGLPHDELEALVQREGNELLRLLLQGHLDLRRARRCDGPLVGADGVVRTHRRMRSVPLETVLGEVRVEREVLSARGAPGLPPLDAELNLPPERYSLGVQQRVTIEAARGSFDEAVASMTRGTAARVPKRQAERLVRRATCDFEEFYAQRQAQAALQPPMDSGSILVVTTDGKGVAMLKRDLREPTRKAAEAKRPRLRTRQSKGEKRNAKRMAMVAAVYTIAPFVRTPEDIVHELRPVREVAPRRPRPEHKRVWASLELSAEGVIDEAFKEAASRDPRREKRWVSLVDGNAPQLGDMLACAEHYGAELTLIVDIIHVIEYLWKAAWSFHDEGSPEAEQWVSERLLQILRGKASLVAGGMRRSATCRGLTDSKRAAVDTCADYLINYGPFLRYDEYLAAGLPIATGVIEGACRHLIQDRMGITGARWSLQGAEAVLRARALRSSGDFDEYWGFHRAAELRRNHLCRYADGQVPETRAPDELHNARRQLRLVRGSSS